MKKSLFFVCTAVVLAFMAVACQKDQLNVAGTDATVCDVDQKGYLVSYNLASTKSLEETEAAILAETPEEYFPQIQELFKGFLTGAQWQMRTYTFNYNSVAGDGSPAVLTGQVSFVCDGTGKIVRKLRSVSLYHIMFNVNQNTTFMQASMPTLRALHHALVVIPLFQGAASDAPCYGAVKGHPILVAEPLAKARQAVDCELAAIELLDKLDCAVTLKDDYYTENMGISNGAAIALATQFYLENKAKAPVSEKIRLRGTFCGAGCYDFSSMLTQALSLTDLSGYSDAVAAMIPYAIMGTVISAYADNKKDFGKAKLTDYFSDECVNGVFNEGVNHAGEPYNILKHFWEGDIQMNYMDYADLTEEEMAFMESMMTMPMNSEEIVMPYIASVYENVIDDYTYRKIFNEKLYVGKDLENGELDVNGDLFKKLMKATAHSDMLKLDWHPASPLRISHSTDDDFLPYDTAYALYGKLSNNGNNKNVSFKTLRGLDHSNSASVLLMLNVGILEHPCPLD